VAPCWGKTACIGGVWIPNTGSSPSLTINPGVRQWSRFRWRWVAGLSDPELLGGGVRAAL
jgi:hypothetical protein